MTDTDLITAGGSGDNSELPNPGTSDISAPASQAAPTAETAPTADVASGDRSASLSTMVLPELRALANQIGVKGASGMRKGELISAIREQRGEAGSGGSPRADKAANGAAPVPEPAEKAAEAPGGADEQSQPAGQRRERRGAAAPDADTGGDRGESDKNESDAKNDTRNDARNQGSGARNQGSGVRNQGSGDRNQGSGDKNQGRGDRDTRTDKRQDSKSDGDDQRQDNQQNRNNSGNSGNNNNDDDGEGRQGRRGRRFRDRRRRERGGDGGGGGDTELRDDDVVQPVAGILDVLDNYAFVRTSGYLAGPNDVYVSMNMVRKNGLRRGDAITGAVRVPKEGESSNQRQKFNPLVRIDTVNGGPVEDAKKRPEFGKLTPLYPNQRLRLETTSDKLTTRVIDLIMPIGKGQRALIVSPPKAGKTTILQDIANAITRNNPECHLMVVLVDERPEEVTDMQRSVKGEVIASTFDRPPSDHTQAAELAIERAKRLVEQGRDVVVLLDSITRLGRAYNNASPASGRILSGGVDSTALYPPKRFLGAARNIEEGGSLTIVATAMVETGSTGDTVIFEEFKGTGNAELKLDRKIAERRVFPAVDVNPSGTRKDELLLSPDEFGIVHKLRRVLSGLDSHQAIDLLMSQLRKTKTNYEFLVQVSKTTPGSADVD